MKTPHLFSFIFRELIGQIHCDIWVPGTYRGRVGIGYKRLQCCISTFGLFQVRIFMVCCKDGRMISAAIHIFRIELLKVTIWQKVNLIFFLSPLFLFLKKCFFFLFSFLKKRFLFSSSELGARNMLHL